MNSLFELISVWLIEPFYQWGMLVILFLVVALFTARFLVWKQLYGAEPSQAKSVQSLPVKEFKTSYLVFMGAIFLGALLGFMLKEGPGLLLGIVTGFVAGYGLNWKNAQKAQQQIEAQLPLFLRALGSTLKAGYSVPQALEFVALEVQDPLRKTLSSGVQALRWQQPLEQVLDDWRIQVNVPEFRFLTDSLRLQSRSGGNLVDLCNRVAYLLEERAKLERDVQSFTAQGKMSGYLMACLWPMSLVLFAWLAPHHTNVLFKTLPGQILLGISFSLASLGFYFMWRLVRLKI